MNKKGLAVLMRTRMLPSQSQHQPQHQRLADAPSLPLPNDAAEWDRASGGRAAAGQSMVAFEDVKEWMRSAISTPADKIESVDASLRDFSQGYLSLLQENRHQLLHVLARDYDVNRMHVHELMHEYLSLELPHNAASGEECIDGFEEEGTVATTFYRTERNLRDALKPMYAIFFERLNEHPGGLKLLAVLRADLLSLLARENAPSLRALDSYLKEKLITWLSPAALELHQITWNDSASLLEKIVAYEAVHPIRSLLDLKRRLSVGRRCFSYLHPAIPGEPLIFIEVALLHNVATSIKEVLWDDPPIPESDASCALFYSISSTQPGLSGINLGKFIIKRVIELLRRDMPYVTTFATLSPIPGFMKWLLSKLGCQLKLSRSENVDSSALPEESCSTFKENIFLPEEETALLNTVQHVSGETGLTVFWKLLNSPHKEWTQDDDLLAAVKPPIMRLCARYLFKEKKRKKAVDAVANFHLQNGALIEKINWMADPSEKGMQQSGGIMVNYVYRLENIEENARSYFNDGTINASCEFLQYV